MSIPYKECQFPRTDCAREFLSLELSVLGNFNSLEQLVTGNSLAHLVIGNFLVQLVVGNFLEQLVRGNFPDLESVLGGIGGG